MEISNNIILKPEHLHIAPNPHKKTFMEFGVDELFSLLTAMPASQLLSSLGVSSLGVALGSVSAEKIGLFWRTMYETYQNRKKGKISKDTSYLKQVREGGKPSLIKDVTIHDPLYTLFLTLGQEANHDADAWMISFISFFVALGLVSPIDQYVQQLRHTRQENVLVKSGAISEKYFEAKLFVDDPSSQKKILEDLSVSFDLSDPQVRTYHDQYYLHNKNIKSFNDRSVKIRERKRISDQLQIQQDSLQFIFTKAKKELSETIKHDNYNFYPLFKEKFTVPKNSPKTQDLIQKFTDGESQTAFSFQRTFINNPTGLYAGVDASKLIGNGYFLELKVYKEKKLLIEALRKILKDYSSQQFTVGKEALIAV